MTKREKLLWLLRSRTQAQAPWTLSELGERLYCTERTVQRHLEWLRDYGHLPDTKHVVWDDTYPAQALPTLLPVTSVGGVGSDAGQDTAGDRIDPVPNPGSARRPTPCEPTPT
jgi:hypothetical protein